MKAYRNKTSTIIDSKNYKNKRELAIKTNKNDCLFKLGVLYGLPYVIYVYFFYLFTNK